MTNPLFIPQRSDQVTFGGLVISSSLTPHERLMAYFLLNKEGQGVIHSRQNVENMFEKANQLFGICGERHVALRGEALSQNRTLLHHLIQVREVLMLALDAYKKEDRRTLRRKMVTPV